ncbi:MAG: PEP-CTERM sorting domain-containing protein [Bryobacteraceae bacterium]
MLVPSVHASAILNAAYWSEGSTDSSGNYTSFAPGASQLGSAVIGAIPTGSSQSSPDQGVVNYFRTGTSMAGASAAYNGILLGNLSGYTGLTATFSLNNDQLDPGQQFAASGIVGETYTGEVGSNAGLRLMFMGGILPNGTPGVPNGTPNEWWSNPTAAFVTSMNNGQDVTLTVNFDPSQWSNYYGHVGTENSAITTQFDAALSGVTRLGLSFGSGYFFSDGFAFNTGGNAFIELDSINPIPDPTNNSAPEPATIGILASGLGVIAALRRNRARS